MMDNREILFLKPPDQKLCEDMSKLKIDNANETEPSVWDTLGQPSGKYDYMVKYTVPDSYKIPIEDVKVTGWGDDFLEDYADVNTIRISSADPTPRVAPLIITSPRPVPYPSDTAIPWNYGAEVYYHGVKQDPLTIEDLSVKATIPDVDNITGSSKVTRTGRVFSPEISPPKDIATPTRIPAIQPVPEARGKEPVTHPAQPEVPKEVDEDTFKQEMEEILKIIKKSDYNIVEQLGQTPSKISMLALLLCSEAHANALVKFLKNAHVPQDTTTDQFEVCIASLAANNGLGFSDADLTSAGRKHNKALHISVECKGITLSRVLVDIGSALNILPKTAFDRIDVEGLVLKPSDIIVTAFDGSKRTVLGELTLPVKVGSQTFDSTFFIMDIRPAYSCLLGRPWIHGAGAVTSTLHQKLKYPVKGKVVTVCGEEEYMVSHLQSFRYLEMEGEFFE